MYRAPRQVPGAGLEPARLIQPTDFKSASISTKKVFSVTLCNTNYKIDCFFMKHKKDSIDKCT